MNTLIRIAIATAAALAALFAIGILEEPIKYIFIVSGFCIVGTVVAVLCATLAQYCFTRIHFINERDTTSLVGIFKAIAIMVGIIVLAVYPALFR
ncbi:MAG: hypothetical protein JNL32_00190 [Candidatus Kapabacteria bacterium]|nr:hypothetical protein [Candidatus Kapabacteria bacterium]